MNPQHDTTTTVFGDDKEENLLEVSHLKTSQLLTVVSSHQIYLCETSVHVSQPEREFRPLCFKLLPL